MGLPECRLDISLPRHSTTKQFICSRRLDHMSIGQYCSARTLTYWFSVAFELISIVADKAHDAWCVQIIKKRIGPYPSIMKCARRGKKRAKITLRCYWNMLINKINYQKCSLNWKQLPTFLVWYLTFSSDHRLLQNILMAFFYWLLNFYMDNIFTNQKTPQNSFNNYYFVFVLFWVSLI